MLDILRTYLSEASSPEFLELIQEAHASLDLFDVQDYEGDFIQLMMLDDAVDQGETVQNIHDATLDWQKTLLLQLGVTLAEESRIDHYTRILVALHKLETFEDPEKVIERAGIEMAAEELLAEMLAVSSHIPPEEWLAEIHEVAQPLIQTIIELSTRALAIKQGALLEEEPTHLKYVTAYKQFQVTLLAEKVKGALLMDMFFEAGLDVGYPFVVYLNMVGTEIGTLPPVLCAANFISMALISTDGADRPREVIKAHLEHYITELDQLTRVDQAVSQLLLAHEKVKTTGVKAS